MTEAIGSTGGCITLCHATKTDCFTATRCLCHHPRHNLGGKLCSRELSVNVVGSEEGTRRILKAWALLGHSCEDRASHMDRSSRQNLLDALNDGTLLSEAELDKLIVATAEEPVVAPFCLPPDSAKPKGKGKLLLGRAAKGVPKGRACTDGRAGKEGWGSTHYFGSAWEESEESKDDVPRAERAT